MAVKADEISRIIEQKIAGFEREIDLQETGTVISVGRWHRAHLRP